jgi:phosphoglycolate phosphatase
MKIKAIIFDVDGTLFSSHGIIHEAYAAAINKFNNRHKNQVDLPSVDTILHQIGNPVSVIFNNLFPALSDEERTELSTQSRNNLIQAILDSKGLLYPGVKDTVPVLAQLGYALRLASNGKADYVNAITKHYGLAEHFGPFIDLNGKDIQDKGDVLNVHKSILNVKGSEMVMVGDRIHDMEAAEKAECRFIGVSYGHGAHSELKGAAIVIDRFSKLLDGLPRLNK